MIEHLITHIVLMPCSQSFCNIFKIPQYTTKVLKKTMLGFVPHTPHPCQWTTPNKKNNTVLIFMLSCVYKCTIESRLVCEPGNASLA